MKVLTPLFHTIVETAELKNSRRLLIIFLLK